MNDTIRVSLNLHKTDAQVIADAIGYHDGLDGNPNFTNPPIALDVFRARIDAFASAVAVAVDGGKKAIIERNNLRVGLTKVIRQLGHWVEANCKDDPAILKSSGFPQRASKTRKAPQPLPAPLIVKVQNSDARGQVIVQVKPVPKALSYELQYASIDAEGKPGSWTHVPPFTSSRPFSVTGLTPGTIYAFQVRALGKAGYTEWSTVASRMST